MKLTTMDCVDVLHRGDALMGTATVGLVMAALGATQPMPGPASPAPLWRGANRLLLSCSADPAAVRTLGPDWCAIVLDEARRGARIPVGAAEGATADRNTLMLQVAVHDGAIALTIARAIPIDDAEGEFFRRGPALPPGMAGDPPVRAAFADALDTALPWRRGGGVPPAG
jgi:hypothetical protein